MTYNFPTDECVPSPTSGTGTATQTGGETGTTTGGTPCDTECEEDEPHVESVLVPDDDEDDGDSCRLCFAARLPVSIRPGQRPAWMKNNKTYAKLISAFRSTFASEYSIYDRACGAGMVMDFMVNYFFYGRVGGVCPTYDVLLIGNTFHRGLEAPV